MKASTSSQAASVLQIAIFSLAATRAALVNGRVAMEDVGALSAGPAKTAKNGGVSSTAKSVRPRTGAVSLPGGIGRRDQYDIPTTTVLVRLYVASPKKSGGDQA